jgi:hypothetical protein
MILFTAREIHAIVIYHHTHRENGGNRTSDNSRRSARKDAFLHYCATGRLLQNALEKGKGS